MKTKPHILVIVGPTASGKSALAVELARALNGEVISADSRQVYKGLDIGSGKITKREMRGVPHYLLDVVHPKKVFTANDFLLQARTAIEDILARGKLPIICGGTGFYIDALVGRVALPNVPPNPTLRARLAKKSAAELYELLKTKDPRRARSIDKHNPVRLIRALEIAHKLGTVPAPVRSLPYRVTWIGIVRPDTELRTRIHTRLLQRMKGGMVKEVRDLHMRGLSYKRMRELGLEYRYLALYLASSLSKAEMLEQLEHKIWDYAQRQMRYWKRNTRITWVSPETALQTTIQAYTGR